MSEVKDRLPLLKERQDPRNMYWAGNVGSLGYLGRTGPKEYVLGRECGGCPGILRNLECVSLKGYYYV